MDLATLDSKTSDILVRISTMRQEYTFLVRAMYLSFSGPCMYSSTTISGPCMYSSTTISGPCKYSSITLSGPCMYSSTTISGPCIYITTNLHCDKRR